MGTFVYQTATTWRVRCGERGMKVAKNCNGDVVRQREDYRNTLGLKPSSIHWCCCCWIAFISIKNAKIWNRSLQWRPSPLAILKCTITKWSTIEFVSLSEFFMALRVMYAGLARLLCQSLSRKYNDRRRIWERLGLLARKAAEQSMGERDSDRFLRP